MVTGYEMMANGREWIVQTSMSIHSNEPKQKAMRPIRKQRQVPLDLSNLLRYEISRPGKTMAEMGSHAHLRQSWWVIEGKTSISGFWSMLMIQLLQEILKTQWTNTPTKVYKAKSENKRKVDWASDCILSNFIRATVEQIAMTSLMNQWPLSSQQRGIKLRPIVLDMMSIILIFLNIGLLRLFLCSNQTNSEAHTVTPTAPKMLPIILAKRERSQGIRQPNTMAKKRRILKDIITLVVSLKPQPEQDQALLQMELKVRVIVENKISINKPISKGLQNSSGLQSTRYYIFPSEVYSCILLI